MIERCCALDGISYDAGAFLLVVDPLTGEEIRREQVADSIWDLAASPDGRLVGFGTDGEVITTALLTPGGWDSLGPQGLTAVDW